MSIIKHKEQRVGIYIDAQNLYHSGKNLYHSKVNFGAIVKDALDGRKLVRAVAYVISTESGDETGFFDALTKVGIETKVKDLQIFSSGAKKADWDVGLAIDAVKLAHRDGLRPVLRPDARRRQTRPKARLCHPPHW